MSVCGAVCGPFGPKPAGIGAPIPKSAPLCHRLMPCSVSEMANLFQPVSAQASFQTRRNWPLSGKYGPVRCVTGKFLPTSEMGDPPRDSGRAVDKSHFRPEGFGQLLLDQREMGAGQHHSVDRFTVFLPAQPIGSSPENCGIECFTGKAGFGGMDQFGRGMAQQQLVRREFRFKPVNIGLADRGRRAEQADHPGLRHGGGRLDRGHRAHDRHVQCFTQGGKGNGGGGVAGNGDKPGMEPFDQPSEKSGDTRCDLDLALFAIGQGGSISDIKHRRQGYQLAQFGKDGETAYAGIEQQDR